jgi:hypothetical protein
MKRYSVVLGFLVVGCLLLLQPGCGKDSTITTGSEDQGPAPKITFEKVAYHFGDVGINTKRMEKIPFSNTGEGLLKIAKLEGCCGVNVKLDKREYSPGENGVLEMEWTAKSYPTEMAWRIVIHSNDRVKPELVLTMEAKLVQRIACEPERIKLTLEEKNAGCPKLTIRSLDDRPFSIKGFKSTADCITAEYDPTLEATEFVLEPKVDLEKLRQNLQGLVGLDLSHPEGREVTVLFNVVSKYTVSPKSLIVWRARPGKPQVMKIQVLSNYGEATDVESISSMGETITVKMLGKREIPKGYELEVEVTPMAPAVEGKTVYTDTFSLKLKGGEKLPLTCNAYYKRG